MNKCKGVSVIRRISTILRKYSCKNEKDVKEKVLKILRRKHSSTGCLASAEMLRWVLPGLEEEWCGSSMDATE
jgi:hypothetical protein